MKKTTASRSTYWEKLKSPKWQKKRLEVMERAKFKCEKCRSEENTLNVHHIAYKKGADPWDYANDELQCLCENCHAEEHELDKRLDDVLLEYKKLTIDEGGKEYLIGFMQASLQGYGPGHEEIEIFSTEQCRGIACYYGYEADLVNQENGIYVGDIIYQLAEHDDYVLYRWKLDFFFKREEMINRYKDIARSHPEWVTEAMGENAYPYPGLKFWPKECQQEIFSVLKENIDVTQLDTTTIQ